MYLHLLKHRNHTGFILTDCLSITHTGVTLRLYTRRENCSRTQQFAVVFNTASGEEIEILSLPLAAFTDRVFVSHYTSFRRVVLDWLKHAQTPPVPVNVELALRAMINRDEYVRPLSDKLRHMVDATTHRCERMKGVSLTPHRASLVFPTLNGYYVRVDVRLKGKKYITYFSVSHPDQTVRNVNGHEVAVIFTAVRYGYIMGVKGFYSLINGWCRDATLPQVAMLQAVAPELLALISDERKQTVDDFFTIINNQVSAFVSAR